MKSLLVILLLLAACPAGPALGEPVIEAPLDQPTTVLPAEQASQSLRLTLSQALALAESRNPDLRATDQGIEVARTAVTIAGQRPNPRLSYAFPVGPAERKQRLVFDVPLETGGRREARLAVAEDGIKEAELARSQARLALLNQTRNAYVELGIASAWLGQGRIDVDFYDRLLEAATRRFEAGDIAQADVIRSEFERDQSRRFLFPAENRVESAELTLNRLLGQPLETSIDLVDNGELFPTLASLQGPDWTVPDLATLQEMARERRPDLALAAQQVESARHRLQLARANQSPEVSLQAALLYDPTFPAFTYQAGVQVELPWGGDRNGEVQQARARETEALLRYQATLATADHAVALAWTSFQNAVRQLRHDVEVLQPQANQVLELAHRTYDLGQGDITEVLLAGQSVQRQNQAYLNDVAQFHRALGELELAVNVQLTGVQQ